MEFSNEITDDNILKVYSDIEKKSLCVPYYARKNDAKQVMTDMDVYPYPRFYRGQYLRDTPIVFEREAGFRRTQPWKYKQPNKKGRDIKLGHTWQTACSTITPTFAGQSKEVDIDTGGVLDYQQQYMPILFR